MEETLCSKPRTVEEVYYDFKKRRAGLIKALTSDAKKFYKQCDPDVSIEKVLLVSTCALNCTLSGQKGPVKTCKFTKSIYNGEIEKKENLCLYGLPSQTWEVNLPVEEVPPDLPEPTLGINFARDAMKKKDWLSMVAVHSDSWLIAVAFHFAARFGFVNNDRKRLFLMINELPTIYEVVAQKSEHHTTGWKVAPGPDEESSEESEEEYDWDELLCGVCGGSGELRDECWICCEVCDQWYHSLCVKITPAKLEHLRQFKCPDCTSKKGVSA